MGHAIALISLLFQLAVAAPSGSVAPVSVSSTTGQQVVEVEWSGTWYPAVILDQNGSKSLIHYVGYDSSWDEWVGAQRLRLPTPQIARGQWRVGDRVEVEWSGTWWEATVLELAGSATKIGYVGYDPSWDEWVEPARIR